MERNPRFGLITRTADCLFEHDMKRIVESIRAGTQTLMPVSVNPYFPRTSFFELGEEAKKTLNRATRDKSETARRTLGYRFTLFSPRSAHSIFCSIQKPGWRERQKSPVGANAVTIGALSVTAPGKPLPIRRHRVGRQTKEFVTRTAGDDYMHLGRDEPNSSL